jgi:hypothetical protein
VEVLTDRHDEATRRIVEAPSCVVAGERSLDSAFHDWPTHEVLSANSRVSNSGLPAQPILDKTDGS